MTESPLVDSGFAVPVFSLGDDLIACLNKAISFIIDVASSRFPSTNNQLRTSSNPRNHATIQDSRVIVQQVQGRQGQSYSGEGNMARQCTQPKRPQNAAWYKDKAMLAKALDAGQILDEEQLAFLADLGTEDIDTYDSECDDISNAKAVLMANISNYGFDVISEVPHSETYLNDMENQEKECLLQTFTVFKSESKEKEDKYMENEIDLEKKIKELDNILFKVGQSAQTVHMLTKPQAFYDNIHKQALGYQNPFHLKKAQRIKPTLYDGIVMSDKHVAMPVIDDEETLILEEESRSKMSEKAKDPEVINKNISHKPIDYEKLNRLTEDFGKRFTPQQELSAEQAFWLRMSDPTSKPSDALPVKIKAPKELPKISLVNESLKKLKFHLAKFDNVVKIRTTPNARTEENEDLKAQIQDKVFVITSLKNDLRKIKGKEIVDIAAQIPSANTIVPGMFKLDLEHLAPRE
ncbi:hypothetical protein Tco_0730799 [Tanacetum coccineum]